MQGLYYFLVFLLQQASKEDYHFPLNSQDNFVLFVYLPVYLSQLVDKGDVVKEISVAYKNLVLAGGVLADLNKKVEDEEEDIKKVINDIFVALPCFLVEGILEVVVDGVDELGEVVDGYFQEVDWHVLDQLVLVDLLVDVVFKQLVVVLA